MYQFISTCNISGKITEKSGGRGGSFGLTYDTDQWKLEEFSTKENAYSLCEFIGNISIKRKVLITQFWHQIIVF